MVTLVSMIRRNWICSLLVHSTSTGPRYMMNLEERLTCSKGMTDQPLVQHLPEGVQVPRSQQTLHYPAMWRQNSMLEMCRRQLSTNSTFPNWKEKHVDWPALQAELRSLRVLLKLVSLCLNSPRDRLKNQTNSYRYNIPKFQSYKLSSWSKSRIGIRANQVLTITWQHWIGRRGVQKRAKWLVK